MKALSWKPKASGKQYCAPACGGGCTRAEFDLATEQAEALARRLDRSKTLAKRIKPGWKPRVWENLGWHYEVTSSCGRWKVSPFMVGGKVRSYMTILGEKWAEHARTAEDSIKLARKKALDEVTRLAAIIDLKMFDTKRTAC